MARTQSDTSTKDASNTSLDRFANHPPSNDAVLRQASLSDSEPSNPEDWEDSESNYSDNEQDWEVFLADDDERDPLPAAGDFWIEFDD